jgi:uncharacterized LabA/DUF88 family protein
LSVPLRVAVFIDGANVYQAFRVAFGSARYAPARLAVELAAGRPLVRTGFYIAAVPQDMDAHLYAGQQRFLARLQTEPGLTVWTGRMARSGGRWYEKGVDVKIATDMVALAYAGEYDVAILVSGDGDLAPAVHEVRRLGRRVENAMTRARRSWHLGRESSSFRLIDRALFDRARVGAGA